LWAIGIVVSILGIIVLLLCIPVEITFRVDAHRRIEFSARVRWLFGLISRKIGEKEKKPAEEKVTRETEGVPVAKTKRKMILRVLRTRGMVRQSIRLLRDTMARLRLLDIGIDVNVGLDDPADTGLLFGLLAPAVLLLGLGYERQVRVHPVFASGTVFEGYSYVDLRLWPIHVVLPLMRFSLSKSAICALRVLLVSKWRKEK